MKLKCLVYLARSRAKAAGTQKKEMKTVGTKLTWRDLGYKGNSNQSRK